ncbi:anthranilate phosphoribosyltransferase [Hydrogenophilus thiooxidans]|uniref:anthranilate phosphoribosyltransferase n=1 Tax=Hydrogenophilus thiooxidans TaxID=2820326 RepID=UPI001C233CFB|nr:hypothetical protein [Hydrogenophilus thiooxidans]
MERRNDNITALRLAMREAIQKVATGPALSKNLSREACRAAFAAALSGVADPVQVAVFLIALRMKRETDEEFLGLLDGCLAETETVTAAVPMVAVLAEPFDGYNRSLPVTPFLPAVLAACGLPTLSIGVRDLGPKHGVTHHRVLALAGVAVDHSVSECAQQLTEAGWSYCDQSRYAPSLYALLPIRNAMIKRSAITTVETVVAPVRGRERTCYLSGYVHPPYARIYTMLAKAAGFSEMVLVRGVEGGVVPSLRQEGSAIRYRNGSNEETLAIDPRAIGIEQCVRAPQLPNRDEDVSETEVDQPEFDVDAAAEATLEQGIAALKGQKGAVWDALLLGGALALWGSGCAPSFAEAAMRIRQALENGTALAHFALLARHCC